MHKPELYSTESTESSRELRIKDQGCSNDSSSMLTYGMVKHIIIKIRYCQ